MSIIEQILNADKAPTSGELLKAGVSFSGQGFEGTCFDHKVLLTAQIREADNGDLNVIIGDDQYLTFPDHLGNEQAQKWCLNDRISFDKNPQGLFRVSAGTMLTVLFNQESAGSVGLVRGKVAEDNINQVIVNAGKISYMNGSMAVERGGTILLPSKLAVTELDEELIVYKKNFGALSLGGAAGEAYKRGQIEKLSSLTGRSFETGYAVQEIVPVTCSTDRQVNVYLYNTLVDQFKACAVYDKNGGPLELAHRYAVQLGAKQDYSFYSGEPLDKVTQERVVFVTPENFESLDKVPGYSKHMRQALVNSQNFKIA
jgi:hypothetical protein